MAVPTLTPSSQTSKVTLPTGSTPSDVKDNTELPFQVYSSTTVQIGDNSVTNNMFSQYFCTGAANQVAYTFKKLGGDVLDIEITTGSVFSAYEESVLEYSYIVNIHQAKNILGSALGAATGTFNHHGEKITTGATSDKDKKNLRYPEWQFSYGKKIGDGMATDAGFGGTTRIDSAYCATTTDVQASELEVLVESAAVDSELDL